MGYPPHFTCLAIKSLAAMRYAQLLLSKSHSRIAAVAAGGDVEMIMREAQGYDEALLPR